MDATTRAVDAVEQAARAHPYCPCGRHATPVWHDGAIWLECSSWLERPAGGLRRVLADLNLGAHLHEVIIEAPAAEEPLAA
jgi:hypothetical protein